MKFGALITVYNEVEYIEYALTSILKHFDHIAIVEGAYQETLTTNPEKPARSNDGTRAILQRYKHHSNITIVEANEQSDPQQRSVGMKILKQKDCDWCVIVDADEVWEEDSLDELKTKLELLQPEVSTVKLDIQVFVNDFWHYTWQTMSRCFRIKPHTKFISDNEIQEWQQFIRWTSPTFFHFAYVKNLDRFMTKVKWWACRGGSDWFVDSAGKYSSPNHKIYEFTGEHPEIMKNHPYYMRGRK